MLFKKIQPFIPFLLLIVFFGLLFLPFWSHTQSYYFQDETEHLTPAWMMNNFGTKLYEGFSTNHQPLPIFFSVLIERIIPYTQLYQLVTWIRLMMFGFYFAFAMLMVWRFRWRGLVSVIFLNLVNYYFFGWQVLAESLVAPPIMYLFHVVLEKTFSHALSKDEKNIFSKIEPLILSFFVFWIAFSLLPLWPVLFLFSCWMVMNNSNRSRILYVGTGLFFTAILFLCINPFQWYHETVFNNIKYFLPYASESASLFHLNTLLYPLQSMFHLNEFIAWYFLGQLALVSIGIFLEYKKVKASKFLSRKTLSLFLLLGMFFFLNNRVDKFPALFYQGFHLMPLVAGLSTVSGFFAIQIFEQKKKKFEILSVVLIAITALSVTAWCFEPMDKVVEHHINYSRFQIAADALKTIRSPGDTLLTGADGKGYVNMIANIPLADRQNFHLNWSYRSPELRAEFEKMMAEKPPTFIIFDDKSSMYWDTLLPVLEKKYQRATTVDGKVSNLYISNEKISGLSEAQISAFNQTVLKIKK